MAYTTIDDPTIYFNIVLYSGNASASRAITGVGFQPDWVWVKGRSTAYYHGLWDVVRTNKSALYSNATSAEDTGTGGTLGSFNSDGFTLPNESGGFVNNNGTSYVSWNWKAGGSASTNENGSIDSSVSVNTDAGFSIGTYTGNATNNATVGHGLSSAPQMIIVKQRGSGGDNWQVYWNDGTERNGFLNLTNAFNTPASTSQWGDNAPTSSVFTLGSDTATNVAGSLVFYAFHSVQGYSKFSSYVGNGSADGPFVYTGFSPAFVMMKNASQGGKWLMMDNKRPTSGGNPNNARLFADVSNAESTTTNMIDMFSNGFKLLTGDTDHNASGDINTYMAFAENPFVTSTGVPTTAR